MQATPVHAVPPHAEHFMYHGPAAHESYDAFDHDYSTDASETISYGHQYGKTQWEDEWATMCGRKAFCARFSHLIGRDAVEYGGHHEEHDGERWYEKSNHMQSNHLSTSYYVEPDSVVIHEDAIHARLHLHEHEYFSSQ